ncbi:MAG TPA: hypothetical protein PL196_07260 [Burkholderiaceae bacterium]|nr:hypothetical protein [Burkholderiaceae bacterium]
MAKARIWVAAGAAAAALAAGEARAQIAAINQQTFNSAPPALEDQRRPRSSWVLPKAEGIEDEDERKYKGGFGDDWGSNPYNQTNLKEALRYRQEAEAAARGEHPLSGKKRRKSGDKDPLAVTQEGALSGSFDISVDISTSSLGGSLGSRNKKAGFSTKGLELGDISGGGSQRLSIWQMDEDRKRMRRQKKLVRENQLESDEEVLIRQQQAEASGGTDFFEGF